MKLIHVKTHTVRGFINIRLGSDLAKRASEKADKTPTYNNCLDAHTEHGRLAYHLDKTGRKDTATRRFHWEQAKRYYRQMNYIADRDANKPLDPKS